MEKKTVKPYTCPVLDIMWGGIAINYDALSNVQKVLFYKEIYKTMEQGAQMDEVYDNYVHETFLCCPRIVTLTWEDEETVHQKQWSVGDIKTWAENFNQFILSFSTLSVIHVYNMKEIEKIGKLNKAASLRLQLSLDALVGNYDTIEQQLCMSGIGQEFESIETPHLFWRDHYERACASGFIRSLHLYDLANQTK